MKLTFLLSAITIGFSLGTAAQDARTYAVTGGGNGDFSWVNIRQIDLATGNVVKNFYEQGKSHFSLFDSRTGNQLNNEVSILPVAKPGSFISLQESSKAYIATGGLVAAAAYDQQHNRLFFTPMSMAELRWLDLSSGAEQPKFYSLKSDLLNLGAGTDEANHVTRMVIGADGNGYALTNDANHLIRFTTGKKVMITDLGALVDGASSNPISIHNKCRSWGGDIVADAYGKLYLFTAGKNVFKIDVTTMITTYLGSITGLGGNYTVNGAAVYDDDHVLISSANTFDGFYKVSIKDLAAVKLKTTGQVYNSSDLANANLLYSAEAKNSIGAAQLKPEITGNDLITIYPNPVLGSQVQVNFENNKPGVYTISLTDLQGRIMTTKQVTVKAAGQVEILRLKRVTNGMYLIRVNDSGKRSVFSDKLVIE